MNTQQAVAALVAEKPSLNVHNGEIHNWRMQRPILDWIASHVQTGWTTLETGAGYTTTVFAAGGCNHTTISPSAPEHERIKNWCSSQDIPTDNLTFYPSPSEDILPTLDTGPLDMVLIDGAHAWPFPYLDWYFTARNLKVGGYMIIDDLNIITGEHLFDFLKGEEKAGRWKFETVINHTGVFIKTSENLFGTEEWLSQPYLLDQHRQRAWKWTPNPLNKAKQFLKKSDFLYNKFSKYSKLGGPGM